MPVLTKQHRARNGVKQAGDMQKISKEAADLIRPEWNKMQEFLNPAPAKKLNTVKVIFVNPDYNYTTSVSAHTTEQTAREYFVGATFNVGNYPEEKMRKCIHIEFTDNNKPEPQTLKEVTSRMLAIEVANMEYNKATKFGKNPNGQEDEIESMLTEWDALKAKRNKLKYQ